jgi:hypothetical protein
MNQKTEEPKNDEKLSNQEEVSDENVAEVSDKTAANKKKKKKKNKGRK